MNQTSPLPASLDFNLVSTGNRHPSLGSDNSACTLLISLTEEGAVLFIGTSEHVILLKREKKNFLNTLEKDMTQKSLN